jgi:hypothetical protein
MTTSSTERILLRGYVEAKSGQCRHDSERRPHQYAVDQMRLFGNTLLQTMGSTTDTGGQKSLRRLYRQQIR